MLETWRLVARTRVVQAYYPYDIQLYNPTRVVLVILYELVYGILASHTSVLAINVCIVQLVLLQ